MPEVAVAIEMIKFAKNSPHKFYGNGNIYPFVVGGMKLYGGLATELLSMINLCGSESVVDVVKDYIAFGFICEIDNYKLETVKNINLEEAFGVEIKFRKWYLAFSLSEELKYVNEMVT
jgi:predicted ATP-grasp superfamily ATP-dependent carboligase